jgi:hypothetical protein
MSNETTKEPEQYIGTYYDFQKYLIDPEFRQKFSFDYLTKELGIANLNATEIFLVTFDLETIYYLRFMGALNSEKAFLGDIFATLGISRSKDGFGAKLLVTQITRGDYDIRGDEQLRRRLFSFGRNRTQEQQNASGGQY